MSKLIPDNYKYMTLDDHIYIEEFLNDRKFFHGISKYLCKNSSTISSEVRENLICNT